MVEVDVNVADVLTALGALLVILGVPAYLSARRGRKAVQAADAAATAAAKSQETADQIAEQVRPGNGRRLAQVVEQTNKLLEVVDGRVHDISKRLDAQGREQAAQGRDIAEVRHHGHTIEAQLIAQGEALDTVADKLQTHLDVVEPLLQERLQTDPAADA